MSEQLHILVIDDDADMRELFAQLLLGYGHQVILAESAEEGLGQLPFYRFDVALLDQNLPGMEGLVLGEYLHKNNPEMSIALVTGETTSRLRRLCERLAIRFIEKPFEVHQILDVIETARLNRQERSDTETGPVFELDVTPYLSDLTEAFDMPQPPQRLQVQLARRIREALERMELSRHLSDRDRTLAYTGLVSALVLGIRLPKQKDGGTLFDRYDRLMSARGCRPMFETLA